MKPKQTWVVVADGRTALIFEDDGLAHGLRKVPGGELHAERPDARGLFSDRPGRAFDSARQGRHAMEPPTSAEEQVRTRFVRTVVAWLDKPVRAGGTGRLVLIAPPKMLGDLRAALPERLSRKVVAELDKDLTKAPPDDIAHALGELIAL
jgi:protein required for attachment to host cells